MANARHERGSIKKFEEIIRDDDSYGISMGVRFSADNDSFADIEYLGRNGEYLIIEAKSHRSRDGHNTVHKLFGQLLKENGKINEHRGSHDGNKNFLF